MKRNAVMALLLCLSAAAGPAGQGTKAAVADLKIIDAQGYQKLLEEYRGKPLLVTFWATWCEPCRDEYPMLNELAKRYAPQGLKVVGVNLDYDGDLILMRRFMARYKPVFPNVRKNKGGEAEFVEAVLPGWKGAIPASFLVTCQAGRTPNNSAAANVAARAKPNTSGSSAKLMWNRGSDSAIIRTSAP